MPTVPAFHLQIRPFRPADARAFRELNEEWIARYFTIEDADREVLDDPEGHIIEPGGHIFMAFDGEKPVACCALIPFRQGIPELGKMSVAPECRNLGIGRKLLVHVIEQARALRLKGIFLSTNEKLANAIHLYESLGFRYLRPEEIPVVPYRRSTVFMELTL